MQISPWALNYTDYIIITSSAIEGFSKSTPVLKGSVRERLLYRRKSALVCAPHADGGARRLGSSLARSRAARAARLAGAAGEPCRPSPPSPHPSARAGAGHPGPFVVPGWMGCIRQVFAQTSPRDRSGNRAPATAHPAARMGFPQGREDEGEQGDVPLQESSWPHVLPESTVQSVLTTARTWCPFPGPPGSPGTVLVAAAPRTAPTYPAEHPTDPPGF